MLLSTLMTAAAIVQQAYSKKATGQQTLHLHTQQHATEVCIWQCQTTPASHDNHVS